MARRTVLLVVAIVVAALGAVLVGNYVHDVRQSALAKQQPTKILVAKKVIPAGTTGAAAANDGDLQQVTVPKDAVASADVLSTIEPVANLVTNSPIFPGEQIMKVKFGKPGESTALSIPTAGTMAISLSFDDPTRVDGYVVPGSQVAVFLTTATGTRLLLPSVTVIAIGGRTLVPSSGQNAAQNQSGVVTFGVTEAEAQKLIYGQTAGKLYLALLTKDSAVASLPATSSSNLFGS
jgi:pilus assembly protein CpaB